MLVKLCKFGYAKLVGSCGTNWSGCSNGCNYGNYYYYPISGNTYVQPSCSCPSGWKAYKNVSATSPYTYSYAGTIKTVNGHSWADMQREILFFGDFGDDCRQEYLFSKVDYMGCY